MNAVSSVMSSAAAAAAVRSKRSTLQASQKHGVTVETAVFVDATLYDVMRKTFAGLLLDSCGVLFVHDLRVFVVSQTAAAAAATAAKVVAAALSPGEQRKEEGGLNASTCVCVCLFVCV